MRGPMAMLDSGAHGDFLFTDSTALVLLAKDISRCEEQELQASATWFAGQVCLIIKHCHWSLGVCQLWQPCLIGTNIWICPHLDHLLGHVGCACLGMMLIAFGEMVLAYAGWIWFSLTGMCIVYIGQAVAGCTIATITSVLATDETRGAVMSMQQMAQALGRVVGPVILSALLRTQPETPAVLRSPPPWEKEVFTENDVEDLGRFLCELLTRNHYKLLGSRLLGRSVAQGAMEVNNVSNTERFFPPLVTDENLEVAANEEGHKNFSRLGQPLLRAPPRAAGQACEQGLTKQRMVYIALWTRCEADQAYAKKALSILNGALINKVVVERNVAGAGWN
eukprot:s3356_g1.t1